MNESAMERVFSLNSESPKPESSPALTTRGGARLHWCLAAAGGCLLSCASSAAPPGAATRPGVLAPLSELSVLGSDDDPLVAHRPETVDCSDLGGWYVEDDVLEVNSGKCNYLALVEPAAVGAPAGARVTTTILHFDLTASAPTEAHLALLIAGQVVWEETIPVPSAANVFELSFPLPQSVQPGEPIGLHLHNHGQNTYNFSPLLVSDTL